MSSVFFKAISVRLYFENQFELAPRSVVHPARYHFWKQLWISVCSALSISKVTA
jgi:hypothetical protein